jgi:imidazolonepropionase-like amidohydrolase
LAALLACAAACSLWAQPPGLMAIRDARIVTGSGQVLEKGTVLIKDGLIAAVGATVDVPKAAWVIDGKGLTVYPGLIDGLSSWGLPEAAPATPAAGGAAGRTQQAVQALTTPGAAQPARSNGPEDRPGTNTWVKAADQVRLNGARVEQARSAGFTTAMTFPRSGLIGGQGAVVNLGGETAGKMVVNPSIGLYLSNQPSGYSGYPSSQMGVQAYFRQLWIDLAWYKEAKAAYAANPQLPRPAYDRALENMADVKRVMLPATSLILYERMVKIAEQIKTPVVYYGVLEGWRMVDQLKKSGVPVILNVKWPTRDRDADPDDEPSMRTLELRDKAPTNPIVLAAAGIRFAVSSDGQDAPREVIRSLKRSIDLGLKKEDAIRALTLSAAEIYGVADRLGSVESGKIANLLVTDGDLFDEKTKVQMIFIDGVKYLPAPEAPAGGAAGAMGRRPSDIEEDENR